MAMSGSLAPPLPPEALRPQRQATFTFGNNRKNMYRTVPDPRGFYAQSWMPYYEDRNASDDRRVREMDKRLAMQVSILSVVLSTVYYVSIYLQYCNIFSCKKQGQKYYKYSFDRAFFFHSSKSKYGYFRQTLVREFSERMFDKLFFCFKSGVTLYPSYQCYSVVIHIQTCALCRDVSYVTRNQRNMCMNIACLW